MQRIARGRRAAPAGTAALSFLLLLVALPLARPAAAAERHVLVLMSYDLQDRWSADVLEGLRAVLPGVDVANGPGESQALDVQLHVEYLDVRRHPEAEYLQAFEEFLLRKYAGRELALALASDDAAFGFLLRARHALQPGLPLVFCGVNNILPESLAGQAEVTGVNEALDIPGTVNLALRLFPKAEQFVVVAGTTGVGAANLAQFRRSISHFSRPIAIQELLDLPRQDLPRRLAGLPESAILLRLDNLREPDGSSSSLQQSMKLLGAAAPCPVFTCWDFDLGHGALGGVVVNGAAQGHAAGELALQVLRGRPASTIAVVMTSPNVPMFDHAQLLRFGISHGELPQDATVRNAPASFYVRHKGLIWIGGATVAAMGVGIVVLVLALLARRRAEAALRESEQRYRTYVDNAPSGIMIVDGQGRYLDVNPEACRISGYTREELLRQGVTELLAPERREEGLRHFQQLLETGRTDGEVLCRRKDGASRWWVVSAIRIAENRFLGFVYDVTDRRQQDESRSIFLELLDNAEHVVVFKDTSLRYVMVNPAYTALTGHTLADVVGKTDREVFAGLSTPEQIEAYIENDRQALALPPGKCITAEEGTLGPDGTVRTFLTKKFPVYAQDGVLLGAGVITWEITDRKRAEDEVRMQSRLQELLLNISSTYISLPLDKVDDAIKDSLGEMGRCVNADRAYVFAYHFDEGICTNTHEWCAEGIEPQIQNLQAIPLEMMRTCVNAHLRGETLFIPDVLALDAEDADRQVLEPQGIRSLVVVPMMEGEHCLGFAGFDRVRMAAPFGENERRLLTLFAQLLVNVRHRQELECILGEARQKAESASRAKSEFLTNMSHEIRTPLNGVMGMLQLLQTSDLDMEQREHVATALQACRRLVRLLSDILDLSRIEADKLVIHSAPLELAEVVRHVIDLFMPMARENGVALNFSLDPSIPKWLQGDAPRLQQLLTNIVGNALKFTPSGSVTVEAYPLTPRQPTQARVLFSVSDTGIGIPDDKLSCLFKPFSQVSQGYTRTHQGAGLGLSICKRLVGLMGGNIAVESEPGVGTTVYFCITFERVPADMPLPAPGAPSLRALRPVSPSRKHLDGLRILLAEDDHVSGLMADKLLSRLGAHVVVARDGRLALEMLRVAAFDLVLMDVQMPIMDGLEATRAIRNGEAGAANAGIPIVAMTAYAMVGDRDALLAEGMDGYVAKPVGLDELTATIAAVLERKVRPVDAPAAEFPA